MSVIGTAADPRDLVRPDQQAVADQLALRAAALRAGQRRLRGAVLGRRRLAGAVCVAPHPALRLRADADAQHRAGRYPLHRAAGLAWVRPGRWPAAAGRAHGPCRQGRAALDRHRRDAVAAERVHEDRARAGARRVVPQARLLGADGQPAVPDPAGVGGAAAGRADPEGAEPRHRRHHRGGRRIGVPRGRAALVEGGDRRGRQSAARRRSPTTTCTTTSAPASPPSSIPKATRWAPATTSSSRRSRWAPAACGGRGSCRARRAT